MQTVHQPVLLKEVVSYIGEKIGGKEQALICDGTLGGAGHSLEMLKKYSNVFLIGMDRDLFAVLRCQQRLADFSNRCFLKQANFSDISSVVDSLPEETKYKIKKSSFPKLDGIVLDLGISSDQLDNAERGFSFLHDGPLDMRMNQDQSRSAEEILNTASEKELRKIFLIGGVKSLYANILAQAIIKNRPLKTTKQFANICVEVIRPERQRKAASSSRKHAATVPFQALRIAVNEEIVSIEKFMKSAIELLAPGGRLAVISFHSLEDKVVTNAMRRWTQTPIEKNVYYLKTQPPTLGKLLTKKAVLPTMEETKNNPRSRSARLRVFERTLN